MRLSMILLLLSAVLIASPLAAGPTARPIDDGAPEQAVSGDWEGKIRSCPNIRHPTADEIRRAPSVVRLRVREEPGEVWAFEFLDDVPFLMGVRGFATSVAGDGSFSAEVPYNLVVEGRVQEDARMRFRGEYKNSRKRERLRFTAEYSFPIAQLATEAPFCLAFELAKSDGLETAAKERPEPRRTNARADDLDPDAEAAVDLILRNLRAERVPCARHYETPRGAAISTCGVPHESFGEDATDVLRIVDGVLATRFPEGAKNETWVREGDVYRRSHRTGAVTLKIEFDAAADEIAIYYPVKLADCPEVAGTPAIGELPGATPPTLIPESHVFARFPARARRKKITGSVVLRTTIRTDGSIGEVCVLRVDPPGFGFEESAIEAVRQWRYKPATVDGEPVEIQFDVLMDFGM